MQRRRFASRRGGVVLVALVATALAVIPGVLYGPAPAGASTAAAPATTTASPSSKDATALLEHAAQTMGTVTSFHFELTNAQGTTSLPEGLSFDSATGDVRRPDRFQANVDANFKGLSLHVKIVGVGSKVWFQNPLTRKYEELSSAEAAVGLLNPAPLLLAAVHQIQHPVVNGTDKINGETATRVDGVLDIPSTGNGTPEALPFDTNGKPLPIHIWIDGAGRIVRLRLDGPVRSEESSNVVRQLDLSKFNEPVKIEPPTNS